MSHKSAKRMRRATLDLAQSSDGKGVTMDKLRKVVAYINAASAERFGATAYALPPEAQQARKSA